MIIRGCIRFIALIDDTDIFIVIDLCRPMFDFTGTIEGGLTGVTVVRESVAIIAGNEAGAVYGGRPGGRVFNVVADRAEDA